MTLGVEVVQTVAIDVGKRIVRQPCLSIKETMRARPGSDGRRTVFWPERKTARVQ